MPVCPPKTYDEKQAEALLVTCAKCNQAYYMTVPQTVCAACVAKAWRRNGA